MNTENLLVNIIDQIKEVQLKLGYAEETIHLYFPRESLNDILRTSYQDEESLLRELQQASAFALAKLGEVSFGLNQKRIEIRIPPQGARYVMENIPDPPFLKELIRLFSHGHGLSIEEIRDCFAKFSEEYVCEKMKSDSDFDYVLYFTDTDIDACCYCVKMEMGHAVYHRFTREDFCRLTGDKKC